jgi:hypothetical protein
VTLDSNLWKLRKNFFKKIGEFMSFDNTEGIEKKGKRKSMPSCPATSTSSNACIENFYSPHVSIDDK